MSILIKGAKMPRDCTECPFFIKSNSPKYPFVDCKIIGRLGSVFNCIGISVDCPLVELPPHGDLIDYNFCLKNYELLHDDDGNPVYAVRMRDINAAPAIIEAEEVKTDG